MPRAIRLDKAFINGVVKRVRIISGAAGNEEGPPINHAWFVLNARVNHRTGTDTLIEINYQPIGATAFLMWNTVFDTALANGSYPIFNTLSSVEQAAPVPLILTNDDVIYILGDALAEIRLTVLEWKP